MEKFSRMKPKNEFEEGKEKVLYSDEAIKVIEAWEVGFNLGNTLKYISRAGKKDNIIQDLEKALFYLDREIQNRKNK